MQSSQFMSGTAKAPSGMHWSDPFGGPTLPTERIFTTGPGTTRLCNEKRIKRPGAAPTPPYPQRLAVFPNVAAGRGVLVPVQAAVVEIFLFPVRVRGGNGSGPSTERLAAPAPRQPWQRPLLGTRQQPVGQQAAPELDPSERRGYTGSRRELGSLRCPAGLAHLVFRIIRDGIGPKILSIMARCSRLSCV